jgi:hypothetical protein
MTIRERIASLAIGAAVILFTCGYGILPAIGVLLGCNLYACMTRPKTPETPHEPDRDRPAPGP